MTRTLVTGGVGFVGARVTGRLVELGHDVVVLDDMRLGAPENLPGDVSGAVRFEVANLEDREQTRRVVAAVDPERVIHLAAMHFIPDCNREPGRAVAANALGTQNLIDALPAAASLETVVIASTAAVYAPSLDAHSETSELGPTDIYGLTKLFNEQQAQLFHQQQPQVGVAVARLFNVFGPGETNEHLIPAVLRQALEGDVLRLGNLATARDYVFVDDVAAALLRMSEHVSGAAFEILNVGTERQHDGHSVVAAVSRVLGRELRVEVDPERQRLGDRPSLLSDCTRARDVLGWSAEVGLDEGLQRALEQPLAPASA